ncbi:hypothetical protein Taro_026926 [Colocasia esculenta]|uniref:Exonuclease domain-containing protein n=1 Tax=Colocasia esculenta TaxID=4460 RepID=A0A843VM41_COLES|nr:hypothetical protein [Colocasia esculenta]
MLLLGTVRWVAICGKILLQTMSLVGIRSGNFHQLRNSLGTSYCCKFFRFQTVTSEKTIGSRRCRLQTTTSKVGGRNHKPESRKPANTDMKILDGSVGSSSTLNANQSGYEFKNIQHYNIQQKIVDGRVHEWPAVVLVFDIETTGFSRKDGRIIEIAIRDLHGGKNSTFQTLVNPQKIVLNSNVHGITSRMVNRPDVPRMEDLIPILIRYVRSRQTSGKPVLWVAHNARRFDVPFIVNEFKRCSVEVPSDWFFVDTLPLARQLVKPDGSKLPSISLNSLREHYEISLQGPAHRAMEDVMVLCKVLPRMSFELKISVADLMQQRFQASDVDKSTS